MTFADYLETTTAKVRRELETVEPAEAPIELRMFPSAERVFALFSEAHLFNLGEAEDINQAGQDLKEDLVSDFEDGVPAPFDNLIVAFHRPDGWGFEWHMKLAMESTKGSLPEENSREIWMTVDLSQPLKDAPAFAFLSSYQVLPPKDGMLAIALTDPAIDRAQRIYGKPREEAGILMSEGVGVALRRIALISHPSNYIVRTAPKLTPREERRRRDRGDTHVRKRPYYIVIEHDVLVDLNPATRREGAARSPVPHARRGHWMRLAERCKEARAAGRDRVWRKEAYVGQREFEDEKNRYEVLLGRHRGQET